MSDLPRSGDDGRFERAIRAIQSSRLSGADVDEWVRRTCDDVADGFEAECPHCETAVHEGPCVSSDAETEALAIQ